MALRQIDQGNNAHETLIVIEDEEPGNLFVHHSFRRGLSFFILDARDDVGSHDVTSTGPMPSFFGRVTYEMMEAAFRSRPIGWNPSPGRSTRIDHLAKVWYESWQDGHAQIVPAELTPLRTLERLRERLQAAHPNVRVVGPSGEPVGFCVVKGNELAHLFVSAPSRGSGVAVALMADAEARLSLSGVETAFTATHRLGANGAFLNSV